MLDLENAPRPLPRTTPSPGAASIAPSPSPPGTQDPTPTPSRDARSSTSTCSVSPALTPTASRVASAAAAQVRFGGRGAPQVPASAWPVLQEAVDCLARNGSWTPTAGAWTPVEKPLLADSKCALIGDPPYAREKHPAFFFNWSSHEGCALAPFSRATFCAALGGRDVLIVGDSMNYMLHDSLLSALLVGERGPIDDHRQMHPCRGHNVCAAEAAAAGAARPPVVRYARNDYLSLTNTDVGPTERAWLRLVTNDTLLILNRGAHYVGEEALLPAVAATLSRVATTAPGAGGIWRATARGPDEATALSKDAERAAHYALLPVYGWGNFSRQNQLVEQLINAVTLRGRPAAERAARGVPGVVFLDIDASTSLRPDHHRDSLHYCIPGPVDHWLALLQGVLLAAGRLGGGGGAPARRVS